MQIFHICFISKPGVCCDDNALKNTVTETESLIAFLNCFKYRYQGMVFLARTKNLCINDYLMFFINGINAIIALYCAFTGGNFSTFKVNCEAREGALGCIIGDITFHLIFFLLVPILGDSVFKKRSILLNDFVNVSTACLARLIRVSSNGSFLVSFLSSSI